MKEFFDALFDLSAVEDIDTDASIAKFVRIGDAIASSSHRDECIEVLKKHTDVYWLPSGCGIAGSPYEEEISEKAKYKELRMLWGPEYSLLFLANRV